ncbi:MAG: PhoX family phosphatase [Alphaproteobacteria bacterium]|nr:PhoX family phosphatase [Alphaproteobacteria bacterium]
MNAMHDDDFDPEDVGVNTSTQPDIQTVISRRMLLAAGAAGAVAAIAAPSTAQAQAGGRAVSTLKFKDVKHGMDDKIHVAEGYRADVLIRWGDPIAKDAPDFVPGKVDAAAQEKQFGYNCDFLAYQPLPYGSRSSSRGLLCSNHEYTNNELMWPGIPVRNNGDKGLTKEQVEHDMSAHGLSVVEVRKSGGKWSYVKDSPYNRRLSMRGQVFRVAGPAAGHARLKTKADPTGTQVIGTLNNCAGGFTPWGTVLTGEENFNGYFRGDPKKTPEAANYARYGVQPFRGAPWGVHVDRFDMDKEPNEPNRFGYVCEYDPYDPKSTPVKRTSIGRIKHEGAMTAVSADGRVALYTGDDERFEYVYKFVTKGKFDPSRRERNMNLLDEGTLYAARFNEDGTCTWLPLVHGQGPLTAANGFNSQADVCIETRRAADLVGATPMDRPEGIAISPKTGKVYVCLTYNERRKPANDASARERANPANPRAENKWGQIVEISPPVTRGGRADHGALTSRWGFFIVAGNPKDPKTQAQYHPATTDDGWFQAPDNITFDPKGRAWITTDGMDNFGNDMADGLYGADTTGPGRALSKHLFRTPVGAEMTGPAFTPDGRTVFVSVQHPGEGDKMTFEKPATRWPDFKPDTPPRPSVVAITKLDGGEVGS